ncbi:hypothetical protein [Streptomyces sp. NBC_01304]|uniref:hypothetical protein n=1 Tax=Streptomyces sp. NBC_01304 TaxID=2903818 RepID=UPI002E166E68|nr:hypothetical protein OG430_10900 [Streptomyces sp. NBC_01304]
MHEAGTGHCSVYCGDARDLRDLIPAEQHGRVALVLTSLPYGNSIHGQVSSSRDRGEAGVTKKHCRYSHDPSNLAHVGADHCLKSPYVLADREPREVEPGCVGFD